MKNKENYLLIDLQQDKCVQTFSTEKEAYTFLNQLWRTGVIKVDPMNGLPFEKVYVNAPKRFSYFKVLDIKNKCWL